MRPKNPSKHVLDLVSAVLSNGILAHGGAKSSPKEAARMFFQVRNELIKGMRDSERSDLPIYLSLRSPSTVRR